MSQKSNCIRVDDPKRLSVNLCSWNSKSVLPDVWNAFLTVSWHPQDYLSLMAFLYCLSLTWYFCDLTDSVDASFTILWLDSANFPSTFKPIEVFQVKLQLSLLWLYLQILCFHFDSEWLCFKLETLLLIVPFLLFSNRHQCANYQYSRSILTYSNLIL